MFQVFRFLRLIYTLSKESHAFLQRSAESTTQTDTEQAAYLRKCYRRILWTTAVVVLFGSVVVPIAGVWIAKPIFGFTTEDTLGRMFIGLGFSIPASLLYLFVGVATGCLFAPTEFMDSSAGLHWRKLIGTSGTRGARVACAFFAIFGSAVMVGVVATQVFMPPTVS
jgi:hypothetical protein